MNTQRVLLSAVFLAIAAAIAYPALKFAFFTFTPALPGSKQEVVVEIPRGKGPSDVARDLVSKGVITEARWFVWLGRLSREWKKVKSGEYAVSPGMTPLQVFEVISSGVSMVHPVTVREGENMYEIAADLESKGLAPKNAFIALCKDPKFIASLGLAEDSPPSLEGYLYPETYFFDRTLTPQEIIREMVRKFLATWGPSQQARASQLGMTRLQVLTLASIIEKETGAPNERPLISGVFHNRLKKRMRLQSDATTIYGMWDRYKGKIHSADHLEVNPYNTYAIAALPAGPISNPSRDSVQAALYPANSDYLFFVSHNDGTHEFTRTFEEHTKAVRKFQLDPSAREGKSWRDLSKKLGTLAPAPAQTPRPQ